MSLSLADLFNKTTAVRTPALMFQGTCSNAGKSILTAALCRILLQDGLSVILPGSKNVATDLVWLNTSGLAAEIAALLQKNTPIIGICGGFQMLGRLIKDPHDLESERKCINGLAFLDLETVLAHNKTL